MADGAAPLGVMNTYATLSELKSRLSVQSNDYDATMWHMLHVSSRLIDRYCSRCFYVRTVSRRFDVDDRSGFAVVDLISVNQLVEDCDGDRVYERVRHRDDYILYPLDAEPESAHGAGFARVQDGSSNGFPLGSATVQINGRWGYRAYLVDVASRIANSGAMLSAASRSMVLDDASSVVAGQTLQIDGEQMFVTQVGGKVVNVLRGVNGTVAASHPDGSELKMLQYPAEVTEATLMLAVDRWRRRDGFFGGASSTDVNGNDVYESDGDFAELLAPYRRIAI